MRFYDANAASRPPTALQLRTEAELKRIDDDFRGGMLTAIFIATAAGIWGSIAYTAWMALLFVPIVAVSVVALVMNRRQQPKLRVEAPVVPSEEADWDARFEEWQSRKASSGKPGTG